MKQRYKWLRCFVLLSMLLLPCFGWKVVAAEYEIVFKAGAHGTLNGQTEVSYHLSTEDYFPNEPEIVVEEGYVFLGWNKQLPQAGTKISGKQVYVAQYAVVIDGVTYTVRYVDENHADIATPKTMLGERGQEVIERAKVVPGYTFQEKEQRMIIEADAQMLFVYTLTNPEEVIRYETIEREVIVNSPSNTIPPSNLTPPNIEQEVVPDNETPLGDGEDEVEKVDDQETPLAKGQSTIMKGIGIFGVGMIVWGLLLLLWKQRRKKEGQSHEESM